MIWGWPQYEMKASYQVALWRICTFYQPKRSFLFLTMSIDLAGAALHLVSYLCLRLDLLLSDCSTVWNLRRACVATVGFAPLIDLRWFSHLRWHPQTEVISQNPTNNSNRLSVKCKTENRRSWQTCASQQVVLFSIHPTGRLLLSCFSKQIHQVESCFHGAK